MAVRGGGSVKCPKCKFLASNVQGLGRHMNYRHRPWRFACRRCGEKFPLLKRLLQHEQLAHGLLPGDVAEPAPLADTEAAAESPIAAAAPSSAWLNKHNRPVPIPLDLQCRECGRQMQSGVGFRSHMCRKHPAKWAKMRRKCQRQWRRFVVKRGGGSDSAAKQSKKSSTDKDTSHDDSFVDADEAADEDTSERTPSALRQPSESPVSVGSSSATNSTKTSTTAPKQHGTRMCQVCQKVCAATYISRHIRQAHPEAWMAAGGGRRKSGPKSSVKQEPVDFNAAECQRLKEVNEGASAQRKLLIKFTGLQSEPQVQTAQASSASATSPDANASAASGVSTCGHCHKNYSCRASLFRHIRRMHGSSNICVRCRRGYSSVESARTHITALHRNLKQSEIDHLLRLAGCTQPDSSAESALAAADAAIEQLPPSAPIETDVAEEIPLCLRPNMSQVSMPPPPPPPPPQAKTQPQVRPPKSRPPLAVASCDLDASIASDASDSVVSTESETHPCEHCHLSFMTKDFLDSHRTVCQSFSYAHFRIVSAYSLAEATSDAADTASAAVAERTPCPFCAAPVAPSRLQRHIKHSAAAEKASRILLHSRPQVYMCGVCYEAFPGTELLQNHQVQRHLDPAARRAVLARRCPECRLWLIGDAAIADHAAAMHGEPTPFGCQVCRTFCPNRVALVTHYTWVHLADGCGGGDIDGMSGDY